MKEQHWIAFEGERCIAKGSPSQVTEAMHDRLAESPDALPMVFDARTSERIERVWSAPLDKLLAQLPAPPEPEQSAPAPKGRGRPRLGVVAREVTLLPRHWEWLSQQPGGASVMLRKLVQTAMKQASTSEPTRQRVNAAYAFMTVLAADAPHFEEVSRALFAGDLDTVRALSSSWPDDVYSHVMSLLQPDDETAD
ncbi:DUF2239 family protein [Hydrogenophaga sp. 5NK40-0174]|uniref:DUF2239 family protein n=1 Tax=Hydrogenophaga sp. 5NK40-0174 TaxID=3127649 RepID=UPI003104ADAE